MKYRIVSSFGLALVLVFSLQNSSSALAAQVEPSESDVLDVIVNYQNIVDSEWIDSTVSFSSSNTTDGERLVQHVRDGLIDSGIKVTSASSNVRLLGMTYCEGGTMSVDAEVSTSKAYEVSGSSVGETTGLSTDRHTFLLSCSGEGLSVLEDNEVDPIAREVAASNESPESEDSEGAVGSGVMSGDDSGAVAVANDPGAQNDSSYVADAASSQPADYTIEDMMLSKTKLVNYALEWTSSPYDTDEKSGFNPAFRYVSQNCTNFVSQALNAAGWRTISGPEFPPLIHNWDVWTNDNPPLIDLRDDEAKRNPDTHNPSMTWIFARHNYFHVTGRGFTPRYTGLDDLAQGDILYVDWDGGDQMNHAMIVTDVVGHQAFISQKDTNRSNFPLAESQLKAKEQGWDHPDWYPVTLPKPYSIPDANA